MHLSCYTGHQLPNSARKAVARHGDVTAEDIVACVEIFEPCDHVT